MIFLFFSFFEPPTRGLCRFDQNPRPTDFVFKGVAQGGVEWFYWDKKKKKTEEIKEKGENRVKILSAFEIQEGRLVSSLKCWTAVSKLAGSNSARAMRFTFGKYSSEKV